MLPQYSIHALRNKHKRIQQSKWSQHDSHSRSTFDDDLSMQYDDAASDLHLATASTSLGHAGEFCDKQTDPNSTSYRTRRASQPRHDGPHQSPISQENETTAGANMGALKKGGVVKWFDEEIQLLMDLHWQGKSWEDIFEVCLHV